MRKHIMLAVPVLIAVGAGSAVGATAPDEPDPDGLVTEEVEPGVERIISDDAGHDLDETHPTYRYDMDDVFVTPDGTVWLQSTYTATDNEANPPGPLLWALGEPGMSAAARRSSASPREEEGMGVICVDRYGRRDHLPRGHAHQRDRGRTGRHRLGRGRLRRRQRWPVPHHSRLDGVRRHHGYHVAELIAITESV